MVADTANTAVRKKPKTKKSRVWWSVHQWVGLKLSIFMSFVLLTGTLAVFSHEIDWLINPGMRVDPATVGDGVNWAAIASEMLAYRQDGWITTLDAPIDRGYAAYATYVTEDGDRRLVYFHPATGALQGDYSWVTVQRVLRFMHRHLFLPTQIGVPIVSALSILLLISLVTSFVVYKKWWRGFFKPLRFRDARTLWGDMHRLAGVWSLWFVALMALTGLWYLAESTLARAPNHERVAVEAVELNPEGLVSGLEMGLAQARAAQPDLRIQRIIFPSDRSGAFIFQGAHRAILVRPRSNTVWTAADTGEIQLVTDGRDLNVHQRISEMADPLHFGYFGGVWTKIIWFVFGAAMTLLSISGAAIYSSRLLKAERSPSTFGANIGKAWKGMGNWRWPSVALCLIAFILWPIVF